MIRARNRVTLPYGRGSVFVDPWLDSCGPLGVRKSGVINTTDIATVLVGVGLAAVVLLEPTTSNYDLW